MNSSWQETLSASGARTHNGIVEDFGDLAAELIAAREATVVSPLVHLGMIECTGDDTKTFLHNQLTSDVNRLDSDSAQHSAWCTAKGRMLASFLLYRNESDYRMLLSADLLTTIHKRLQVYVLRSKVKIADLSSRYEFIGLSGSQAEVALQNSALPAPSKLLETAVFTNGSVIRLDSTRFIIVVAREAAPDLWRSLTISARPAGTPVWHWLDIQSGIPLIIEATKEAFVPQMVNFDKIGGVSFHKGCYPGQEVIARTQYLGKIKRHLYRIHVNDDITSGTAIYAPETADEPCGTVANTAPAPGGGYDVLAIIKDGFIEAADFRCGASDTHRIEISDITLVETK